MDQVTRAIEQGRCAVAVSGALLRDPEVMLALTDRGALSPMALSGPAVAPVVPVSEAGAARALAAKDGVILLVEPASVDRPGLESLGRLAARGPNRPTVVVVARNYNPFEFGSALAGLKVEHTKARGKEYLAKLQKPPADLAAPELPQVAPVKKADTGARFVFTGREEEVAALAATLGEGGPVVVSGGAGVGRAQLVEHALVAAGLGRLPELALGWDVGFDTLIGRLAAACESVGVSTLSDALREKERTPVALVKAAIAALQAADGLASKVMLVEDLEFALGPESDFFRRSRLELLVEALLTHHYPLRLVFTSTRQPSFYREGQAAPLRRVVVEGVKGRFLHDIFEAYHAPEFPRDRFGNISERIHGHPLAARLFAVALRETEGWEALLDDDKFFRLKGADESGAIAKRAEKAVSRLPDDLRGHMAFLSHTRMSFDGGQLIDLKVSRKDRAALLNLGLLDVLGTNENKRYRVHPLLRGALAWRETHDFGAAEELAEILRNFSEKASDAVEKLAWAQEANRLLVAARKPRSRLKVAFPDNDSVVESCVGLIRGKQPRLDIARERLKELIAADLSNSDAWLLALDLEKRDEAQGDEIVEIFEKATAHAAVPEVFHRAAAFWLARRKRPKAIEVMEQAVALLPEEPRLHTRLASLLLRHGRRPEGLEHLRVAMEQAPMLPDAYGLLGQARREEGLNDEAEALLREAARLGADDPVQVARLADLLLSRARVDLERQDALRTEARELLDASIAGEREATDALLLLATLVRETTGDLERAGWLLKQARKQTERGTDRHRRIQIEASLQAMAAGRLDEAEHDLRERCGQDPSDHRSFAALAHVLEAREMFVPAHAEYLRAKERAPQNSLDAQLYQKHLERMVAVIEAQAAGLLNASTAEAAPSPIDGMATKQRVVRRKKKGEADEASEPAAEAVEAAPEASAVEAAPEASAEVAPEAAPEVNPDGHQRVIRRKKKKGDEAAAE